MRWLNKRDIDNDRAREPIRLYDRKTNIAAYLNLSMADEKQKIED